MASVILAFQSHGCSHLLSFSRMTMQYVVVLQPLKWLPALCVFRCILPHCGLENAQKRQSILMGCVQLFRAEEGCGPMTWQMDNADSPGGLACNIFLVNWKVFADSSGPIWWPPFLLTFSLCHIYTQRKSPLPLSTSPAAAWEWTGALSVPSQAWAINYKQPCQRPKRSDCRKPAQWRQSLLSLF